MTKKTANRKSSVPVWIYGLLGVLLIAAGYRLIAARSPGVTEHPTPRAGITADKVVPAGALSEHPDVVSVYAMAEEIPEVLDGIYCHCECSKHSGHYSLLECFESDHGAHCDICLEEAEIAYRMTKEGKSLQEIRSAIDARFG